MSKERIDLVIDLAKDSFQLSDKDSETIRKAFDLIHKPVPLDAGNVFNRIENILSVIDDLQYTILIMKNFKIDLESKLNKIRDPHFVSLVRQQRPSTQAILCEVRLTNPEVGELEKKIGILDNFIAYLDYMNQVLDKSMWNLKEKVNYTKQ